MNTFKIHCKYIFAIHWLGNIGNYTKLISLTEEFFTFRYVIDNYYIIYNN